MRLPTMLLALMGLVGSLVIYDATPAAAVGSADLRQCGNVPPPTDTCTHADDWVNGNLNAGKASYAEGEFVPQRLAVTGLTASTSYKVRITYDTTKSSKHAFDYLGSVDATISGVDPCAGVPGCSAAFTTIPVPDDDDVPDTVENAEAGVFRLHGGTLTATSAKVQHPAAASGHDFIGDESAWIDVTFTTAPGTTTVVLAWGAHIASRLDWGLNNSAASIGGSPFHVTTSSVVLANQTPSGTSQQAQIQAAAILFPARVNVIKSVNPDNPQDFDFTASGPDVDPTAFTLDDDGDVTNDWSNTQPVEISDFSAPSVITELPTTNWNLSALSCTLTGGGGSDHAVEDLAAGTVTLTGAEEGQTYDCTFTNAIANGTLRVIKTVTGGPALPGDFSLHVQQGGVEVTGPPQSPQPGSETGTVYTLPPGVYDVFESDGPAGYASDDSGCNGGSPQVVAGAETTCTIANGNVAPTVTIDKSVDDDTRPETDTEFTFTLTITNTSAESVTITDLTDDYTLSAACQGLIGDALAPFDNDPLNLSDTASCTYTVPVGAPGVYPNTAVVEVTDAATTTGTDDDTQTVTVTDVAPTVTIDKSVDDDTRPETDTEFTFTLTITNTSAESVTITDLSDDHTLSAACQGLIGDALAPFDNDPLNLSDTASCTYTVPVGAPGVYPNTAVVEVTDGDGSTGTDDDTQTVTVTDVAPTVSLTKEADPDTLPEPGGVFTFTLTITNTSAEPVTITDLADDNALSQECIDLLEDADTAPTVLGAFDDDPENLSDTASCTYTVTHTDAGSYDNTAFVEVTDEEGTTATDTADETVTVTNVQPTVTIDKSVDDDSQPEDDNLFTFTLTITNTSPEPVTITDLSDDYELSESCLALIDEDDPTVLAASNANSTADTATCTYTVTHPTAGEFENTAFVEVTDDEESTGTDTDDQTVTVTDVLPTVTIDKSVDDDSQPEDDNLFTFTLTITNTSSESVTITDLDDDYELSESCLALIDEDDPTVLAPAGEAGDSASCSYTVTHPAPGAYPNTASVEVTDDDRSTGTDTDDQTVTVTDVLPTVTIDKSVDDDSQPEDDNLFTFTLTITNTSSESVTITDLDDDYELSESCLALIDEDDPTVLAPAGETGDSVSCTYTVTHPTAGQVPNTASVEVTDDDGSTGTDTDDQTVTVTDVAPTVEVTKTVDPDSVPENTGGFVTYTVLVENKSFEDVVITSISDDQFPAVTGGLGCTEPVGDATGTTIPAGGSCTFTYSGFVPPGPFDGPGFTNVVTVTVRDDEGSTHTDTGTVTVTRDPVANLTVDKVACPAERTVAGGFLTYTITAGNDGNATSADATLVDTIPAGTTVVDAGDGAEEGTVFTDEEGVTTVTWALGPIEVGQEIERKIVVRVDAPNGSTLTNNVRLSAEGVDDATDATVTQVTNEGAAATGHAYGVDIRLLDSSLLGGELGEVGASAPPTDAEVSELLGIGLPPIAGVNVLRQTADAYVENFAVGQGTSTLTKVNLLGGLIKADVVKAVHTSLAGPFFATAGSLGSTFVNLKVNNKAVANVAPNTKVDVKLAGLTVAKAVLMEQTGSGSNSAPFTQAEGSVNMIHVTLLAPLLGFQKGAEIIVGHADSSARYPSGAACGAAGAAVFGEAYTAFAEGSLGGAPVATVQQGDARLGATGGADFDEILGLDLGPLLKSATGRNSTSGSLTPTPNATARAIVEGANALGGAIRADVIDVSSTSSTTGPVPSTTFTSRFVNLVIGSTVVPANPSPNTTLAIPRPDGSILLVIVNEQVTAGDGFNTFGFVNALHIWVLKDSGLIELEVIVGHAATGTHVDAPAPPAA